MAKKVNTLTETELHNMIQECVSSTMMEVDENAKINNATNKPTVQEHWQKDYVGKTFKFFAEDRLGLIAHHLFTFNRVSKLDAKKTILIGDVVFNNQQISGDRIIIDFTKGNVRYHEKGSRFAYNLEIDNRFKPLWDGLCDQLKTAIENTK